MKTEELKNELDDLKNKVIDLITNKIENEKITANKIEIFKERLQVGQEELEWWRTYGEYVAKVHNNVDAEACGFADGDNEYKDNFN
jgi:hypothetical protein